MYGVDAFEIVKNNISNLVKELVHSRTNIPLFLEFRIPKYYEICKNDIIEMFDLEDYLENVSITISKEFDPLAGLLNNRKDILIFRENTSDKSYPCKNLASLRIDVSGRIFLCGCVVTANPKHEMDLHIGNIDNGIKTVKNMQNTVQMNWKVKGILPLVCQYCSIYMPEK
jgi:radical SAM protein with 4Fe4S-binding SPASM domain